MNKIYLTRQRRAKKTREKIRKQQIPRLSVHISLQHIYAQVFDASGAKVIASASTVSDKAAMLKPGVNKDNAAAIGKTIAQRAIAAGVERIAFDRSGFKYHGRVKALADAAREAGLNF